LEDCIFCRIVAGLAPAEVLAEDDDVIVFLALEGHPLVVPKPHVPNIYALSDALGAAVMRQTIRVAKAVKIGLRCDGVYLAQANEPAADQEVFHFHLHIFPRWLGDTAGYAPGAALMGRWPRQALRAQIVEALRRP
jgi:histidine triad (HIT) family protein